MRLRYLGAASPHWSCYVAVILQKMASDSRGISHLTVCVILL
jgi:hypothetical protein